MLRSSINATHLDAPQQVVSVSNPAAGADFSYTVPTGSRWKLISASYTLTTDANVANRLARIRVKRGTPVILMAAASAVQAAGAAATNYFQLGAVVNVVASTSQIQVLSQYPTLVAGDVIDSFLLNKQAGDQISAVTLVFENV